mgnify:FL=1
MKDSMMVKFSEKYSLKREDYFQFLKNSIEQKDLKEIIPISIIYYLVFLYLIIKEGYSFGLLLPAVFMDLFCIAIHIVRMARLYKEEKEIHKLLDYEKEVVVECLEDRISILFKESNRRKFNTYDSLDLIEFPSAVYINVPLLIRKNNCEERELCEVLRRKIARTKA